jgi:hypothetical protein
LFDRWLIAAVGKIPIIAVFTKYDRLIAQFFKDDAATSKPESGRRDNAQQKASKSFDGLVKKVKAVDPSIPCVKVSTKDPKANGVFVSLFQPLSLSTTHITDLLINLTKVTRKRLQGIEKELQVLWVAAQQVNAHQKVDVSIRYSPDPSSIPESVLILHHQ